MQIYRIIIPVPEIETAVSFYAGIFNQQGERVSPGRHYFNVGNIILALYDPIADGDELSGGWSFHENQYLYISVENVHEFHQNLSRMKIHVGPVETMPWGETLFYTKDPFGTPLCFVDEKFLFLSGEG